MIDRQKIAARIKMAREGAGILTATEAAERLGVKYGTYSGHENGNGSPRLETIDLYARRFNVSPEWLIFGKGRGPKGAALGGSDARIYEAVERLESAPPDLRDRIIDYVLWQTTRDTATKS